jgi:hypothetical protein
VPHELELGKDPIKAIDEIDSFARMLSKDRLEKYKRDRKSVV